MLCFRPTKKQWMSLRGYKYPNRVFDAGYRRWRSGELKIGSPADFTKTALKGKLGQPFVLSKDYEDISSDEARAILEAQLFIDPISFQKEIKDLDNEIAAMMAAQNSVIAIDATTGEEIR